MAGRYAMQERFPPWGEAGQDRLRRARAVVVGVGGLGGMAAMLLARAGVGSLRLVDPDRPAWDNLHRQVLFDEEDVTRGRSKVEAAARYLGAVNVEIALEPRQAALRPENALELLGGADVVVDGLDSLPDRHLLNEACLCLGLPLVHAGVAEARGQVLVVLPGQGPCLRCWFPGLAAPEEGPAARGVIGPAASCLASLQAAEALKILLGDRRSLLKGMLVLDLWPPSARVINFEGGDRHGCPACRGEYAFLPRA
jgi:adenylyltransferase/sulfurtransferase